MPDKAILSEPTLADYDRIAARGAALRERIGSVIVGQSEVVELLIVASLCHEHCLIVGVPGLGKTLLVRALAAALRLEFRRIQFTPDMMPADVIGAEILQTDAATGERSLRFVPGPIFAHIVLADEINRTTPKTQAALLEAMAERQVTVGGATRRLAPPFIVVATQNPIEQEGTYPLPEAQLDRFMFGLRMEYPSRAEEARIVEESDEIADRATDMSPVLDAGEMVRLRRALGAAPIAPHVVEYAVAIARATRPGDPTCPEGVRRLVTWGAGPRSAQAMALGAKCVAALEGRPAASRRDVRRVVAASLRHRLVLSYVAAAEGTSADEVVEQVLRVVPGGE